MAAFSVADELTTAGYIALEARWFTQTAQHALQSNNDAYSLIAQPEIRYKSGKHKITFVAYLREDSVDDERSHADVRELHWSVIGSDWEGLIGINKVFWGVMESRHLVDIINQTDLVDDIDGEEKLGQAMLNYTNLHDWGSLDVYALVGFRERSFAGESGRLRTARVVDSNQAVYESSRQDKHIDAVIRYSHALDDWDFAAYYFYGTSREPRFVVNNSADVVAVYDIINQLGVDVQYTLDAWLGKLETLYREGQGNSFLALSAGFEYTYYQILSNDHNVDLGLLFEYHYDGRDRTAAPSIYDNDIFIGMRLAFNDVDNTSLLAGVTVDSSSHDRFYNIEASRRFSDHINAELKIRIFSHAKDNTLISFIEQDDYIQFLIRYYL